MAWFNKFVFSYCELPEKLTLDDLISFPAIHELFVFLAFMIKDQVEIPAVLLPKIQFHSLMLAKEQRPPNVS